MSIISADLAWTYGLHIDPKKTMKLQAVNHAQLACSGAVEVEISFGNQTIPVSLIVYPAIHGDIILSWHDLVKLNILSPNFPAEINKTEMVAEASAPQSAPDVLILTHDNYLDVSGTFGQGESLKPMKGPPMKITLWNDKPIQPKHILTTRQIPIHMQEEADIIKQAIKDGILQKTDEPTDWISPAFFVRDPAQGKKKGKLCLVSDFSELNKYVKRLEHPFPSSKDIINKIRRNSKVFVKLDGLKGYFQIPMDEESSFLTTILLLMRGPHVLTNGTYVLMLQ